MEKVTNKEVLSKLDMKTTMLLQKAKALKLKYFGHIKRHETLERHILEARIDGRRGRGRPTRRWEQDINDWMDTTTTRQEDWQKIVCFSVKRFKKQRLAKR